MSLSFLLPITAQFKLIVYIDILEIFIITLLLSVVIFRRQLINKLISILPYKMKSNKETSYKNHSNTIKKISNKYNLTIMSKKIDYTNTNIFSSEVLSDDIMLNIISYLTKYDVLIFSSTSRDLLVYLHSNVVWEYIWYNTYGRIWNDPLIREIRRLRNIKFDPFTHTTSTNNNYSKSSIRLFKPKQGWKRFYHEFEFAWIDWLLAGFCTPERVLIGIQGRILDITTFIDEHPGSSETLTDNAGCDVSVLFHEIGHSTFARSLMSQFIYWSPSPSFQAFQSPHRTAHISSLTSHMKSPVHPNGASSVYMNRFDKYMTKKQSLLKLYEIHHTHNYTTSNSFSTSSYPSSEELQQLLHRQFGSLPAPAGEIMAYALNQAAITSAMSLKLVIRHIEYFNYKRLDIEDDDEDDGVDECSEEDRKKDGMSDMGGNLEVIPLEGLSMVPSLGGYQLCTVIAAPAPTSSSYPVASSSAHSSTKVDLAAPTTSIPTSTSTAAGTTRHIRSNVIHKGQSKVIFDPVDRIWWCWWTCCGKGYPCEGGGGASSVASSSGPSAGGS